MIPFSLHKETLPNGLRVLIFEMPWAQSVTTRLFVSAGSRYESKEKAGTAHYLEHMLFEGSKTYPSRRELEKAIKEKGGRYGAYTAKEEVVYQAKLPEEWGNLATYFLHELVFNSSMSAEALIREKGIISEELRMLIDNPSRHVLDLRNRFVWGNHPLGQNTAGTFDSIKAITLDDLLNYYQSFYRPDNAVLVVAGNIPRLKALGMVGKDLGDLKPGESKPYTPALKFIRSQPRVYVEKRDLKQAHLQLAFSTEGEGICSPLLPALEVITRMLGLNIFHRFVYDLGISYFAKASLVLLSDNGLITINVEVNSERTEDAIEEMVLQINNLKITKGSIAEAKARVKSGLTLDLADTNEYAHFIGWQELFTGEVKSPEQQKDEIDAVTPEELEILREELFTNERVALIALGPIQEEEARSLDRMLEFSF